MGDLQTRFCDELMEMIDDALGKPVAQATLLPLQLCVCQEKVTNSPQSTGA